MATKVRRNNYLSILQIKADIQIVEQIINFIASESGNSKYLRGQACYHIQQAVEKMIKIQIYSNTTKIEYHKIYDHSIDKLITYGESLGIDMIIPSSIRNNAYRISGWEAHGRYDAHLVTKMTTIEKFYNIVKGWYDELYSDGYR